MALSMGMTGDSRSSSDEANGFLPDNKLTLYCEVSSSHNSWPDVLFITSLLTTLMHTQTHAHSTQSFHVGHDGKP